MKKALILLFALFLLLSCSQNEEKKINVAISQEPVTTDVMVNTSISGRLILVGNVYEKLLVLKGNGEVLPELSSSFSLSSDGKKLSFKIRENVLFHNGKIMTEEDVTASMNRWIEVYAKAREIVGSSRFVKESEGVVSITSDNNLTFLPYLIAASPQSAIIVPEECISDKNALVTNAPGTGPYVMKEWKSGEKISLSAFPSYAEYGDESNGIWGKKKAKTENIDYYFVSDSVTRMLGLQSGEYDIINDLMSDDRPLVEREKNLEIVEDNESGLIALIFNKKEGVMTDKKLRHAVSYALNGLELMKACYGDYGYSLHSDYMEKNMGGWSVEEENPLYQQNKEKAEEIIKREYDGSEIRILTSNLSNMEKIAYAAESELEAVGLDAAVTVVDWASLMERRQDPSQWDIFISAFTKVPLPQMKSFLSPSYPGWMDENSEEYSLFLSLDECRTQEEAESLWQDIQKELWDYAPIYIPGHYITAYAKKTGLKDLIVQDGFYLWNATL